jgi:flagellar hook-length control protein FliK
MQSAVPVAPQISAAASLLPLPLPTPQIIGKMPVTLTEFASELAKVVEAGAPADQSISAVTVAPAAPAAPPGVPSQPPQEPSVACAAPPEAPPIVASQPSLEPPAACALPAPEAETQAVSNTDTGNSRRDTSQTRRSAARRVPPLDTPVERASAPATVQPPPVAVSILASTPERAALLTPRQHAEATPATDSAKSAPMPPVAARQPEPKQVTTNVAPPTLLHDAPAVPPTQPAQSPAIDPTAPMLPISPDPVSRPAAPTDTIAAPVASPHAATPAAQIAPALLQMGHAPDGAQRLTVRLDPPELGHVQVRIDRPPEAPARVEITVEKAETLTLLLRDQPQLQRALDQAGVPAEGRSVTFHVASPEPTARSEPATAPAPGVAAGGLSGDGWHGAPRNGGQPERQQAGAAEAPDPGFTPIVLPGWVRAGLDITA